MKKLVILCAAVCLGALACQNAAPTVPTSHTVRIKNIYSQTVFSCAIGSVSYGSVASGATTAYQSVAEGAITFTGMLVTGAPVNGSFTLSGSGAHQWTITIASPSAISIAED